MTTLQLYQFKHIGSFCLVLFLALFRPAAIWPEVPLSTAPLAVLAAWVILLIKIPATVGYGAFLREHGLILCLIAGYFILCGASLIANYHRYPDVTAFFRWGLTFPIIQSALVACGFLFALPQNNKGPSVTRIPGSNLLVFAIAAAIPTMAFWQILDNEQSYQVYQYTIAGDLGMRDYDKRSILATSTDLGSISAILSIAALMMLIKRLQMRQWVWAVSALLIFVLNAVSGTLSGSRGFFLSIGAGILALLIVQIGKQAKLALLATLVLVTTSIFAFQFAPARLVATVAKISPLFNAISHGMPITSSDLSLNISWAILDDRADLWRRAIEQTVAYPWLGISNGGYRLLNESLGETPINNAHNAFLQLSVDAGIPGLLLGLVVIFMLLRTARGTTRIPILTTIVAGLLFDNFADHSLSWIVITTYTAASCSAVLTSVFINKEVTLRTIALPALGSVALLIVLMLQYHQKKSAFNTSILAEQINQATGYFSIDYWNEPPIMISEAVAAELKETRREGRLRYYPSIASSDYCNYSYPSSRLLYLPSEQQTIDVPKYRNMNDQWRVSSSPPQGCDYSAKDPSQISNWISNYDLYYGDQLKQANAAMVMTKNYIAFFSPIFEASAKRKLTLSLINKDLEDVKTTLYVLYYDAKSGIELSRVLYVAEPGASHVEFALSSSPSGAGFLKLKLMDWRRDGDKSQHIEISELTLVTQ